MIENQRIQRGINHPADRSLCRVITRTYDTVYPDGSTKTQSSKTIYVRDRIIDDSIPDDQEGHIEYTAWVKAKTH